MQRRRSAITRALIVAVLYGVAFLALHPKLWDGEHTLGWDAMSGGWPDLEFLSQQLARGELPLWNPYEMTGYSFLGDPEAALLYPFNWIIALLHGLLGGGSWMIVLKNLFHIVFGALGIHLYLQRQRMPHAACWTGGLSYLLSARLAKGKDQAPIWTVAWFPWMLIALEETIARPSRRTGLLLGATTALALLSGYVPNFFRSAFALLPLAAITLYGVLRELGPARRRPYLRRLAQAAAIAAGVVALLGLPMLLAVQDTFASSTRATLSMSEVLSAGIHPIDLLYAFAPSLAPSHGVEFLSTYVGALPLLLALLALVSGYDRRRLCWGILAASFFLLACGREGGLLPALLRLLPAVFQPWRIPAQYLYVAVFFLCVLAARGMADCLEANSAQAARLRWFALALVLGAVATNVVGLLRVRPGASAAHAVTSLVIVVLSGGLLLGLLVASPSRRRIIAVLSIALLLVDLGFQLRPIYDIVQRKPDVQRDSTLAQLRGLADEGRLADDGYFRYRVGLRWPGVREYFGRFTALVAERFRVMQERARTNYGLLAAGNVRYYAGPNVALIQNQAGGRARLIAPGVLELLDHAPVAYWTPSPLVVRSGDEALASLGRFRAGTLAILEQEHLSPEAQQAISQLAAVQVKPEPVAARVEHLGLNELRLSVVAPARGLLVINERYAPSWQATVDGVPARLLQANYAFRALLLEPGRHLVEMHYPGGKIRMALVLYALTAVGLLTVGLTAVVRRLRRRRAANADMRP